jgi:hypothetical protein
LFAAEAGTTVADRTNTAVKAVANVTVMAILFLKYETRIEVSFSLRPLAALKERHAADFLLRPARSIGRARPGRRWPLHGNPVRRGLENSTARPAAGDGDTRLYRTAFWGIRQHRLRLRAIRDAVHDFYIALVVANISPNRAPGAYFRTGIVILPALGARLCCCSI